MRGEGRGEGGMIRKGFLGLSLAAGWALSERPVEKPGLYIQCAWKLSFHDETKIYIQKKEALPKTKYWRIQIQGIPRESSYYQLKKFN